MNNLSLSKRFFYLIAIFTIASILFPSIGQAVGGRNDIRATPGRPAVVIDPLTFVRDQTNHDFLQNYRQTYTQTKTKSEKSLLEEAQNEFKKIELSKPNLDKYLQKHSPPSVQVPSQETVDQLRQSFNDQLSDYKNKFKQYLNK